MTRPATLVLALAMSFGCGPETDSGAIEGGTAAEGEEASAGSDEEGQSVPSYPQYCGSAPPDGVSLVRAVPGNGTVQIELVVSGADPLACGDAFPQCMAQWESVVPIPSPKPATVYDHFDQLHRLYFANDVCGPGLPPRSTPKASKNPS